MWRSPSSPQIHQKYIYMWNSSYRTPTEHWQNTSDFPKDKTLLTIPGHVADRVLVLWLGVKPEPLRCESRVQHIGPPETSRPHIISTGGSSPRDLHLNAKTQHTQQPASSSAGYLMPNNQQDRNTTPPISREAA